MKAFLIVIIVVVSNCFGTDVSNSVAFGIKEAEKGKMQHHEPFSLVGEWTIAKHIEKGVEQTCNVCPLVFFAETTEAVLRLPSGESQIYKYKISDDVLRLDAVSGNQTKPYLSKGEYKMNFNDKDEITELILSLSNYEQYVLRKQRGL